MRNRYCWLAVMLGVLAVLAGAKAAGAAETAGTLGGNGDQLLKACDLAIHLPVTTSAVQDWSRAAYCMGMIAGVGGALQTIAEKTLSCPPDGMTLIETIHGVVRYLKAHKAELSGFRDSEWVVQALMELYPCKK